MGGISVLVVLGLFMSFYALYLFLIFISIFYLVENYIFESLFLYNKIHSKKSWIPYYTHSYYRDKITKGNSYLLKILRITNQA